MSNVKEKVVRYLQVEMCRILAHRKEMIDHAEDWNGAIRDTMQDRDFLDMIWKYDVSKHEARCLLAGRYEFAPQKTSHDQKISC